MRKGVIASVVMVLLAGGLGFYGGILYQKNKQPGTSNRMRGNFRQDVSRNGFNRLGSGAQPLRGQVMAQESGSMTIKLPDGSSKIIFVNNSPEIVTTIKVDLSQVKTGDTITVMGVPNNDGSVTAREIIIGSVNLTPPAPTYKP